MELISCIAEAHPDLDEVVVMEELSDFILEHNFFRKCYAIHSLGNFMLIL